MKWKNLCRRKFRCCCCANWFATLYFVFRNRKKFKYKKKLFTVLGYLETLDLFERAIGAALRVTRPNGLFLVTSNTECTDARGSLNLITPRAYWTKLVERRLLDVELVDMFDAALYRDCNCHETQRGRFAVLLRKHSRWKKYKLTQIIKNWTHI